MSKAFFAAISIATGILLAPHSVLAAGPTSHQQSVSETSQVVQVKESRRIKKRFGRRHRHGHRRHIGGHFYFDHGYYDRPFYRSCRHLKRKAYRTGFRYWWKRYRNCMYHHYY